MSESKPTPPPQRPAQPIQRGLTSDRYARLRAEAAAPYRGLRLFIYGAFGVSGLLGAFVFLMQAIAGRDVEQALPNLAVQLGVVGLMVWLLRLESRASRRSQKP